MFSELMLWSPSHTSLFARAAAVMRNRGAILDRTNLQPNGLQGADSGLAAGAWTSHLYLHFPHPMRHRLARGILCHLLGSERSALAGALKTDFTSARPAEHITLHVRNRNECVV